MKDLEIYLHIPFCVRKCAYCDFLSFPADGRLQASYMDALKKEILDFPDSEKYRVSTVFFGGGTPSLLPAEWIAELMETLRGKFHFASGNAEAAGCRPEAEISLEGNLGTGGLSGCASEAEISLEGNPGTGGLSGYVSEAEISLECNPGTADAGKLRAYREAGINRLSIGLQSADDRELALLGRIHKWEDFCRTFEEARRAGFTNINVDLMSALPGQTVASWEQTLRRVLQYHPEHISAYSLIIEEGTPFYKKYQEDDVRRSRGEQPIYLPDEESERRMYELTQELLAESGMCRYEISNYARPGHECRHNKGYWQGVDYVGFGLGASSLLEHVRYRNTEDMGAYLAGDCSGREVQRLTEQEQMEEFMFLGLRLTEGVCEKEFQFRFGKKADDVYADVLRKQTALGLLERKGGRIFLTPRGIDVSNTVMAEFLLFEA